MYSVSSRANDNLSSTLFRLGSALGIFFLSATAVQSDQDSTLVDVVEIANRPAVVTGEVINTSDDVQSTETSSQSLDADEKPDNMNYTEYRYGASTVREFRSGDTLMYIEIIQDNGSSYVINRAGDQKPESTRKRSGMVVTRW